MFEAVFEKAALFKHIISAITGLISQANFTLTREGISLQQMDSSHVALVEVALLEKAFGRYRCDHTTVIGIELDSLNSVLNMVPGTSKLELTHDEKNNKLILTFNCDGYESESKLRLIDLKIEELGIPEEYDYAVSVDADKGTMNNLITNFAKHGETMQVEIIDSILELSADGENVAHRVRFTDNEDKKFVCKTDEPIRSLHISLKILKKMIHTGLSDRILLELDDNKPVRITYNFRLAEDFIGVLKYYLAPKVANDGE